MLHYLSLFFALSLAFEELSLGASWENYKIAYGKQYTTKEHEYRLEIFKRNHEFVKNYQETANKLGFTVGLNEYSDLTNEEFRARFNGMNVTKQPRKSSRLNIVKAKIPENFDWRQKGAVTAVKNQGQCGSCWSFSATGSMEGAWFLSKGSLVSLSEQNLVDCSTEQGNMGCNGGLMDQAFEYVIENHGIDTEESYPYTATGPNNCKFQRSSVGATISSFHDVPSGSEKDLLDAVYHTPTSVAIDASHMSFQFYSGGVYNEPQCSSSVLDHGVLAVGFGKYQGKTDYWLVKNSWGKSWGLQGYIMMSRNKDNQCGIATAASYPIV